MTQEQKLQKRLNEVCFPGMEYFESNRNFPMMVEVINVSEVISQHEAFPVTLELVLKALDKEDREYTITPWINGLELECGYYLEWIYLTPFSQQPTETQQALFKIFEIE